MKTVAVFLALCALSSVALSESVSDQSKRTLFFPMSGVVNTVVGGGLSAGSALGHDAIGAAEDVAEVGIDVFEKLAEQMLQANSLESAMMKCVADLAKVGTQAAEQFANQVVDAMVNAVSMMLMQGSSPSAALGQGAGSVLGSLTGEMAKCAADALLGILGNLDGMLGGAVGDILSGVTGNANLTDVVQDALSNLANGSSVVGGVASGVAGGAGDVASGVAGGAGDVASGVAGGAAGVASDVAGGLTGGLGGLTSGITGGSGSGSGSGSSNIVSDAVSTGTGIAGGILSGATGGSKSGGSGLGGLFGKRK